MSAGGLDRSAPVPAEVLPRPSVSLTYLQLSDFRTQEDQESHLDAGYARPFDEQIPVVFYTVTADGTDTYSYISPQITTVLGFPPEDFIGRPRFLTSRVHPDDLEQVAAATEEAIREGKPFLGEFRVRAADGRWVWVLDDAILIRDSEGRASHWQGVLLDITDVRATESALKESENRFRTVLNATPAGVIVIDRQGAIVLANPAAAALAGTSSDNLRGRQIGDSDWRALREDGTPLPIDEFPAMISLRTGRDCEETVMGIEVPDRETLWLSVNSRPLYREGLHEPVGAVVAFFDISQRRRLEAALRHGEARFRALVQNSYDVITVVAADGRRTYVSPSIERVLGYRAEDLEGGDVLALVHPEDIGLLQHALAACAAGAEQTAVLPLRFRHRNGTWRHFEVIGTNQLDNPILSGIVFNSRDVTLRREAELALRASEARFRSLFEGARIASALVDRNGVILIANAALGEFLGYPVDQLLGMRIEAISHPDDEARQGDLRRQLWDGDLPGYQLEKRYRRSDGEIIWGLLSSSGIRDDSGTVVAALGQIQDITARMSAEVALRDSEERFRTAFDRAPIGIALFDQDGHFRQVNASLCELVGYESAELLNMSFADILHPDDLGESRTLTERMWAGEINGYQVEERYVRKDGQPIWVQLTASPVQDTGDDASYAIAQVEDITGRRHLEMERAVLLASEREYTRQLRALTDMRSELTSMVSHELNAPISALRMMTSMLATRELSAADEVRTVTAMQEQIGQLERLVADVARAGEAEREDFSVQFHPVSLTVLLENAAATALAMLAGRPFAMEPIPDVHVWCDPERCQQVISNLIANIARHTPPDTSVVLRSWVAGERAMIEIADTGPGLTAEDQAIIFEKFGRGRVTSERRTPGTGLGLYVSRRIARAHGGDLAVESKPGAGATFRFSLKVAS
ncbi:MAG: PAS domain S-box protein [Thermomicrobiales bacterium]